MKRIKVKSMQNMTTDNQSADLKSKISSETKSAFT
ncbi:MAG: hypothetical protein ACI8Y3_001818, partial [Paraglaciecola sp.]